MCPAIRRGVRLRDADGACVSEERCPTKKVEERAKADIGYRPDTVLYNYIRARYVYGPSVHGTQINQIHIHISLTI